MDILHENLVQAQKSYVAQKSDAAAKIAEAEKNLQDVKKAAQTFVEQARITKDRAIVDAYEGGVSVARIARLLGTSDRTNIMRILRKSGPVPPPPPPVQTAEPLADYTVRRTAHTALGGMPGWVLTYSDGVEVEVAEIGERRVALGPNKNRVEEETCSTLN